MKTLTRFLFVILQFGCVVAVGQERSNSLQVGYGFVHSRLIDDGYSKNLLFRGTNSKFNLGYIRETDKYLFHFSIETSLGKIKSKSGDLPSNLYTIQPSLGYLRSVTDHHFLGKQNRLFVGAGLSTMNYIIANQPMFDNVRILSLHGVYIPISNRLQLDEKQRLTLTYRLPVAVYVNRLLWNGGASDLTYSDQEHFLRTLTTNGSFKYIDVFRNVQFNAEYARRVGKKADFVVRYEFRYFSDPASLHIYSNELSLGLKFSF